ncbi:DUF4279 domain-containing protein [Caballeronia sp. NK8]|uniref:DUF4279 domain-containing protein n=1 Tax=Caballeronia sp. NK8 TaxID=140098 RepID=UPI001BB541B5|nr:DUF4279 domain-containing protein [Caballeronia sp. NK8]BCQ24547.1 DUF4279 domain-containing protein [Caballeronia sp. NK8]
MNQDRLAYASFSIHSDTLDPAFWTAYFGGAPDWSMIKGQHFVTPSGRLSSVPARVGGWGVGSEHAVQSDALEPHLRYLIIRLGLPRVGFRELLNQQEARMRFFCYWDNYSGDRVPEVPDDIRIMIESMGGTIEIDEYR